MVERCADTIAERAREMEGLSFQALLDDTLSHATGMARIVRRLRGALIAQQVQYPFP